MAWFAKPGVQPPQSKRGPGGHTGAPPHRLDCNNFQFTCRRRKAGISRWSSPCGVGQQVPGGRGCPIPAGPGAEHIRIPAPRRHLLGDRPLRLTVRQRRHRPASPDPTARAAIGGSLSSSRRPRPTLASRCNSDIWLFCGCSSSISPRACRISFWAGIGRSSNFGIRGARDGGRSAACGMKVSGGANSRSRRGCYFRIRETATASAQSGEP